MILVWFSCGASSAIATKIIVDSGLECRIIYCDPGGEHEDNIRFLHDVEKWVGRKIEIHKNEKYKDHFDVIEKTGYLVSAYGARCTTELKKKIRFKIQHIDDLQVYGFTLEEKHRADKFQERNEFIKCQWPLIDQGLTKQDCLGIIWKAGIKLPVMYDLGYNHNNCIGCVKGGAGYWNKIRNDFPDHFSRMARLERQLKRTVIKGVYLDTLNPKSGNFKHEPDITCGLGCQLFGGQQE